MRHDGVAVLDKGLAIACARRLVLTHSEDSESTSKSETVHYRGRLLHCHLKNYF